jgi:hypothetical protein
VIWVLGYYRIGYGDEFYTGTGEWVDVLRSDEPGSANAFLKGE